MKFALISVKLDQIYSKPVHKIFMSYENDFVLKCYSLNFFNNAIFRKIEKNINFNDDHPFSALVRTFTA